MSKQNILDFGMFNEGNVYNNIFFKVEQKRYLKLNMLIFQVDELLTVGELWLQSDHNFRNMYRGFHLSFERID